MHCVVHRRKHCSQQWYWCQTATSSERKIAACCAQMWVLAAQFEVRQLRLDAARKILGMAIGMAPKAR